MPIATDANGNAMYLDGNEWKPAQIAADDKGNKLAFDGQQWSPIQAQEGASVMGALKAAGSGLVRGATALAGLPGDAKELVGAGVKYAGDKIGLPSPSQDAPQPPSITPTSSTIKSAIEGVTGPLHDPQNKLEEYIQSIAEMAPAIAAGPGGLVRRAISQVAIPGAASQAAGDIPGIKGTAAEPFARAAAAMVSPSTAERIVTPLSTAPTRTAAVANLRHEGVDVSAGQSTGSKLLRKAEGELGGSSSQGLAERQAEQFTSAVMRRVGENAERATPEVVDQAFNRIGGNMNRLATNNNVTVDPHLANALTNAENEYNRLVAPSARAPVVQHVLDDIDHQFQQYGVMRGDVYQQLRSQIGSDARSIGNDPRLRQTLYDIQHALDDAMERAIQRQNPNDLGAWREARTQYRNLLTVEKAINSAGEAAASGLITPQNLARAVKSVEGQRNYSRARTDLATLARNGSEVMAPLANSETASRARIHAMFAVPGAIAGAEGAHSQGLGWQGILGGAIAGAAVPRLAGEGLMRGRRYIGNSVLQGRQTVPSAFTRGLLSQEN